MFFTTGPISKAAPRLAVGDISLGRGMSDSTQNVVAFRVRLPTVLNERRLIRVMFDAVLLTVCGLGTHGVRARVAAHRNKPERCVLPNSIDVEDHCALLEGMKHETVPLECKL